MRDVKEIFRIYASPYKLLKYVLFDRFFKRQKSCKRLIALVAFPQFSEGPLYSGTNTILVGSEKVDGSKMSRPC